MKIDLTPEEIEAVKTLRKNKEEANALSWQPKLASDYSSEEKCLQFDKLHKMALEHFKAVKDNHHKEDDTSNWFFEALMNLLGKDVWKAYNKFLR